MDTKIQHTIYLRPQISKLLKMESARTGVEMSEIVERSLNIALKRKVIYEQAEKGEQ